MQSFSFAFASLTLTQLGLWFLTSIAGGWIGYQLGFYYFLRKRRKLYEERTRAEMVLRDLSEASGAGIPLGQFHEKGLALLSVGGNELPSFEIRSAETPEENRERLRKHLERHAPEMGAVLIEQMVTMLEHHIDELTAIEQMHRELDEIEPEDFGDMGRH